MNNQPRINKKVNVTALGQNACFVKVSRFPGDMNAPITRAVPSVVGVFFLSGDDGTRKAKGA